MHFPDSDPRFKDADSLELLRTVVVYLGERGFAIGNVDATVVLERPKLAPYRDAIRERLAGALGLRPGDGQRQGDHGRGDGLRRPRRGSGRDGRRDDRGRVNPRPACG